MAETQRVIGDGDVVHCKRAAYDVYVGRGRCPRTGQPGEWGNPFVLGSDGDRVAVIAKYRAWLLAQPALVEKARRDLAGKVLGCWCAPQSCHGDVLTEVANSEACEGCGSQATREDAAGEPLTRDDLLARGVTPEGADELLAFAAYLRLPKAERARTCRSCLGVDGAHCDGCPAEVAQ